MRFSPHRTIPNDSIEEIAPGYDSLSDDDSDYEDSFQNSSILSSPSKSTFNTPSKPSGIHKAFRNTYKSFHSSPLASSPLSKPYYSYQRSFDLTQEDKEEEEDKDGTQDEKSQTGSSIQDELDCLLKDLSVKERYEYAKDTTHRRTRSKRYSLQEFNSSSRPSSTHSHGRQPSLILQNDVDEQLYKQVEELKLQEVQDSVINSLESRLSKRSKEVANRVKQIEEEKRRIEEEKKRLEEERKRLEEERRLKEEAERKRIEEEQKKQKELEERQRKEAEAKAKLEKELAIKQEAEKALKQKQEEELLAKKRQEEEARKGKGITNFAEVEKTFKHYKTMISTIKSDIVEVVKKDTAIKKAVMTHKRKINPKFGQLTNSLTQLSKISAEVTELINESKANPLAFKWILNFVAKAIVSQAETEVRAKPSSSLPIAKLTLNLLCEFPELKEYLIARFVKKCPFVIGYSCDITTENGRSAMGWKRHEDSKWEDEISYDERMAGMMTLYAVLTRLKLDSKYYSNFEHPLPISNSWILLSRILNTSKELITNTHFIVLTSWWDACAFEFLSVYGKQAIKLLNLMWIDYPALVKEQRFSGANTLMAVGEDWGTRSTLKRFNEMEA